MDLNQIRNESIQAAIRLRVHVVSTLPLLEAGLEMRSSEESVRRILAMNAIAAAAYGFDKGKAIAWLDREELTDSLSQREKRFIFEGVGETEQFQLQIEGMWALSWSMGIVNEMLFSKGCDERFVTQLPNLKLSERSDVFRNRVIPRPIEQVVAACDLAYCLHWAIRQSELTNNRVEYLKPYVVIERRRALEWLLSQETWDEVSLDT